MPKQLTREQKIKLVEVLQEKRRRAGTVPQSLQPTQTQPDVSGVQQPRGPQEQKVPSWGDVPLAAAINFPESVGKYGSDIVKLGFQSPEQTGKMVGSLAKMGLGFATTQAMGGNDALATPEYKAYMDELRKTYGSDEALRNTIANDPARFLGDLAAVASGAGALAKAGGLAKTGSVLSGIGKAVEPTNIVAKVAGAPFKATATAGKIASGIATGAGPEAISIASRRGGKDFVDAMRGRIPIEEIATEARGGLANLKTARGVDYSQRLAQISQNTQPLSLAPVNNRLSSLLNGYGIKSSYRGGQRQLDFSRSVFAGQTDEQKRLQSMIEILDGWGSQPGDLSPVKVDVLKRNLSNFYSENRMSRQFVESLSSSVRDVLRNQVPGYRQMTKNYETASELIKELEVALSLGSKSSTDAALRKLGTALRQRNEFREHLVKALDDAGPGELLEKIAGASLSKVAPEGLIGRVIAGAGALSGAVVDPSFLTVLAIASPRAVGETARAYGFAKRSLGKVSKTVPPAARSGLYEASQTQERAKQP